MIYDHSFTVSCFSSISSLLQDCRDVKDVTLCRFWSFHFVIRQTSQGLHDISLFLSIADCIYFFIALDFSPISVPVCIWPVGTNCVSKLYLVS